MNQLNKLAVSTMAIISLGATLPGSPVFGQEKKGTTPYVTHFIFRPLVSLDIGDLGTATTLEAVGTTQNMKGEKMLDKMSARCVALNVASGDKKYIDGACVLADSDGDKIFSTFDTRDLDKSQPDMNCGTHIALKPGVRPGFFRQRFPNVLCPLPGMRSTDHHSYRRTVGLDGIWAKWPAL